jgi:hypothetical protein
LQAFLLGLALGVMATVSICELIVKNALSTQADGWLVCAVSLSGWVTYYLCEPLFPRMEDVEELEKVQVNQVKDGRGSREGDRSGEDTLPTYLMACCT